ncbi:MAG: putative Na+/H+ antiporter [Chlamydiales bacterium]|nr:putative Na+/H+ antiporter [Chlamydiales bacterium]
MHGWKPILLLLVMAIAIAAMLDGIQDIVHGILGSGTSKQLIIGVADYQDAHLTFTEQLSHRLNVQPFNLIATILFCLAIVHTLLANRIHQYALTLAKSSSEKQLEPRQHFLSEITYFLGEVEVVFGMWAIPLFLMLALHHGWDTAIHYVDHLDYTEPLFVFVIMTLASAYPVVRFAEYLLKFVARLGYGSPKVWWITLLTLGPPLGSLITEPAAMTLTAMLLARKFYAFRPTPLLAYGTLGLLFTNISVGGVLTDFAAPPVLMVAKKWGWTTPFMITNFGLKALVGIALSTLVYYLVLAKEFKKLALQKVKTNETTKDIQIPAWITFIQLGLLIWAVWHNHYPALFLGGFVAYLGFYQATLPYQSRLNLRSPLLVGFFLAGLVIHVTLQAWWIEPLLPRLDEPSLMSLAAILTAFIDNAAITSLATLIPNFEDALKYAVVSGAVIGGGLTVIANAPNPAGQSLLQGFFPKGISPLWLFVSALPSALIMLATFYFLR